METSVKSAKAKGLQDPPDILLTTPESLEGMLISLRIDRASWFGALRVAIVDELHAFAGDDRGWHLRAVLGRLQEFATKRGAAHRTFSHVGESWGIVATGSVHRAAGASSATQLPQRMRT